MNKITVFLMTVIAALCFTLGTTMQGRAQEKSYTGVVPFVTSNDRVGFFDQSNGKIYMYDSNISQCVFVGQLQGLGQPIQTISANNSTSNL